LKSRARRGVFFFEPQACPARPMVVQSIPPAQEPIMSPTTAKSLLTQPRPAPTTPRRPILTLFGKR